MNDLLLRKQYRKFVRRGKANPRSWDGIANLGRSHHLPRAFITSIHFQQTGVRPITCVILPEFLRGLTPSRTTLHPQSAAGLAAQLRQELPAQIRRSMLRIQKNTFYGV